MSVYELLQKYINKLIKQKLRSFLHYAEHNYEKQRYKDNFLFRAVLEW